MANTPNLDLEKPAFDDADWHTPLNSNADKIDAYMGDAKGSETSVEARFETIEDEITDARGSAASLDARLDQALNEDGTLKGSAGITEWAASGDTGTFVSTSSFSVPGDKTAIYTEGRK
jgi:hypothetical protein